MGDRPVVLETVRLSEQPDDIHVALISDGRDDRVPIQGLAATLHVGHPGLRAAEEVGELHLRKSGGGTSDAHTRADVVSVVRRHNVALRSDLDTQNVLPPLRGKPTKRFR